MGEDNYDVCRGKVEVENLKDEIGEMKQKMSDNFKDLYDKWDEVPKIKLDIVEKMTEESQRTDKRFWKIFFGMGLIVITIIVSNIISKLL